MSKLTHNPFSDGFIFSIAPSMKPWKSRDPREIEKTCEELFSIWDRIINRCDDIFVEFIVGNGEHILRWYGDMDDVYEWDSHRGHNNGNVAGFGFRPIPMSDYIENPPKFTYSDLKFIIDTVRRIGKQKYKKNVYIGMGFEPGPEFAESQFRYCDHPELLTMQGGGHGKGIMFDGKLHADNIHKYDGYPDGVPEGEPFGRFLGKQLKSFVETFGIDIMRFSNGLGFGTYPWNLNGRNFNTKEFGLVDFSEESEHMINFWKLLNEECSVCVGAQGTNYPVGSDLATKCIPLREFYDRRYLSVPSGYTVSVYFDESAGFGMQALMSRSCHADGFGINFYLHDPWYPQNPFNDYPYDEQAFDLYLPSSVSVIGSQGQLLKCERAGVAAANDEKGSLRPDIAGKFIPHLEKTLDHLPSEISIMTQLYPFQEYHDFAPDVKYQPFLYFADCYTSKALDDGLPLNSVCATENFDASLSSGVLNNTIIYTPMPFEGVSYVNKLINWVEGGKNLYLFGPENLADEKIRKFLGLASIEGIEGELTMYVHADIENIADEPLNGHTLIHRGIDSAGAVTSVLDNGDHNDTKVLMEVEKDSEKRVYALEIAKPEWNGGKVVWLRGSLPFKLTDGEVITYYKEEYLATARFARYILSRFDYTIIERWETRTMKGAQIATWRNDNAYYFTGYAPDNTLDLGLKFPEGAPIWIGNTCILKDGIAHYRVPSTFWKECRAFVKQKEGKIRCHRGLSQEWYGEYFVLYGLNHADVTLYLPPDRVKDAIIRPLPPQKLTVVTHPVFGNLDDYDITRYPDGKVVLKDISETVQIYF